NPPKTVVCLDSDWDLISGEPTANPDRGILADSLAYMIYTSGSTGKPKGTLIAQRGLSNLIAAQQRTFNLRSDSRILQSASLSFDASIFEMVMALSVGATLCLATSDDRRLGPGLLQHLRERAITHVTLPPSVLATLPAEALPALQTIIVAGEAC